jgi:cytochrome c553
MKILCLLLPLLLWSEENITESFISDYEYGEMLYNNPRGVSCAECHGASGEGKTIIHYQDIHGEKEIRGSDIRKNSLIEMIKAVNSYHKVMPRYYLSDDEVKMIYNYLQKKNTHKSKTTLLK